MSRSRTAPLNQLPKRGSTAILLGATLLLVRCDLEDRYLAYHNPGIGLSLSHPRTWKRLSSLEQLVRRDRTRAESLLAPADPLLGEEAAQALMELFGDSNTAYFVDDVDASGTMIVYAFAPLIEIHQITRNDLRLELADGLRGPAEWGVLPLARHPDVVNACANYEFRGIQKVQCRWMYLRPPFGVLIQITVARDHVDDMRAIARTIAISGMRLLVN